MATIIQTAISTARHFVVVKLENQEGVFGYEMHYDKIIEWCTQNITGKWYSGKRQQLKFNQGDPLKNYVGTEDNMSIAIFNFEDQYDKVLFILKWV